MAIGTPDRVPSQRWWGHGQPSWSLHFCRQVRLGATILRTFPPQTRFFSSPERIALGGEPMPVVSQERVTGEEYLAYLRSVVNKHEVPIWAYQKVTAVTGHAGDFRVTVTSQMGSTATIACGVIVLATGGTDRSRRLGVPGEDLALVSTHLGDPHRFFGRRVLVVGGRNSAAESALRLYRVGADVTISYRHLELNHRVKYWIRPEVETLMLEGEIHRQMPTIVEEITPHGVILRNLAEATTQEIPVDDVLLQIGFEQDPAILQVCQIQLDASSNPVVDEATMRSSVPGVFVVGTARAGTQNDFGVFIESCHRDAAAVAAALAGREPPPILPPRIRPEQ
ncbi:MAG: NAD(P)-binding domain-containing protein [Actinomycetia bacterium]|nr:NAD(P)-binding domain-containing protein [Actinomycetes bacterium]